MKITQGEKRWKEIKEELIKKREDVKTGFWEIGRLLVEIKERGWWQFEYKSFNEFLRDFDLYPNGYKMMKVAKAFPEGLPIGIIKAEKLIRFIKELPGAREELVKIAEKVPANEIEQAVYEKFKKELEDRKVSVKVGYWSIKGEPEAIEHIKKMVNLLIEECGDKYGKSPVEVMEHILVEVIDEEGLREKIV